MRADAVKSSGCSATLPLKDGSCKAVSGAVGQ
jgi:hypothetical protein